MKEKYINDILAKSKNKDFVELYGWVKKIRKQKAIAFYDLVDSTGEIQIVLDSRKFTRNLFKRITSLLPESAVKITGVYIKRTDKGTNEILAEDVKIYAKAIKEIYPPPRSEFPIFESRFTDHVLKNRDVYLRNPKLAASLRFKSKYIFELHNYFQKRGYFLIEAPILTEKLLYDDKTAFSFKVGKNKVWLSQCCTFQLEPAVMAFEKVYNLAPSFRAEHSRSDRHLNEYSHLKVELAWADIKDLIKISEDLIYTLAKRLSIVGKKELECLGHRIEVEKLKPPYKQISYNQAVKILKKEGIKFEWGKSLTKRDEAILTKKFKEKPLWVLYLPRKVEGFPFKISPIDKRLTVVSDLIAPNGFGEIMGVAEKICDEKELLERMTEKKKSTAEQLKRYKSYIELRRFGLPFHGGIGMGVDRVARYFLGLPHVKDVLPYPRLSGRRWNP